jgi:hypothetical protein
MPVTTSRSGRVSLPRVPGTGAGSLGGCVQPECRLSDVRISISRRSAYRASAQALRTPLARRVILEVRVVDEVGVVCDMTIRSFGSGEFLAP